MNSLKEMIYEHKETSQNYLNNPAMWEIKQINDDFIIPISQDIINILLDSLETSYNSQLSDRILYLVVFTFGVNIIFLILCYPFLQEMNSFVQSSREMLTVIPIEGLIMCKGFDKLVLKRLKK